MGNKGYLAHSITYPFISVQNVCTFKTIHWQFKYLSCMAIPIFTPEYKHLRLLFHLLIFFELSDNITLWVPENLSLHSITSIVTARAQIILSKWRACLFVYISMSQSDGIMCTSTLNVIFLIIWICAIMEFVDSYFLMSICWTLDSRRWTEHLALRWPWRNFSLTLR